MVATVSAAAILASCAQRAGAATSGQDWPQLQGGAEHTGAAPDAPRPPLKVIWRSGPSGDARVSSPAVIQGLAVATARNAVVGLDPVSGRVLWTAPRADGPLGTPSIDRAIGPHGAIVFTEGDRAANSAVAALDGGTRQRLWTTRVTDVVIGSPVIDSGTVYVGTRDRAVYAIDALSGKQRWRRITSGGVKSTPAVAGGRVLVTSLDDSTGKGRLSALDVATGASRWSYAPARPALGISSATVGGGRVYVGFNDQTVRAFALSTGRLMWAEAVRASFSPLSTLAFSDESVYAVDDLGGVYRFGAATGHRFWDYQFPSNVTAGSPLVATGAVYVGMDDGTVAAIDLETGHLVWRSLLRGGPMGALAPADDRLLAPAMGAGGGMVALGHDPNGRLIDQTSPTQLDLVGAVANFGGAFLVMTALLLGLFRWLARRRGTLEPLLAEERPVGALREDRDEGEAP